MKKSTFINILDETHQSVSFNDCITVIDQNYHFYPTAFHNGECHNPAGQNNGSCKIFAFGQLHELSEAQTLACFGDYYRIDVLQHPDGEDHQNIRQFMITGWAGISFAGEALKPK